MTSHIVSSTTTRLLLLLLLLWFWPPFIQHKNNQQQQQSAPTTPSAMSSLLLRQLSAVRNTTACAGRHRLLTTSSRAPSAILRSADAHQSLTVESPMGGLYAPQQHQPWALQRCHELVSQRQLSASARSWFHDRPRPQVSNEVLNHWAKFNATPLTLGEMQEFGLEPSLDTVRDSATFLMNEIPVRLSQMAKDLERLPGNLFATDAVQLVHSWYLTSLSEFINMHNQEMKTKVSAVRSHGSRSRALSFFFALSQSYSSS
jgi:Mitochondrial branched-chain alpha-ketoacid dehydrogenase kinase